MKKDKKTEIDTAVMGQPDNSFEQINKYGTYNIQPTNDSDNEYPAIAQGISDISKNERRRDETTAPNRKKPKEPDPKTPIDSKN